jgi:predicted RecA/RadA family phage recombinase
MVTARLFSFTASIITAPIEAESTSVNQVAEPVLGAVIVVAACQVNTLVGVGITELPFATARGLVQTTSILATTIVNVTKTRNIGTAIRVVIAFDPAWVRATISGPIESHTAIGLTLRL